MIEVPPKIWRPKVVNRYTTPLLDDEDVDDILDYSQYGKCVYKPDLSWSEGATRNDLISYYYAVHADELKKDLKFDPSVDDITRKLIPEIIIEYWDSFAKEGAKRPILGYEFGIDTGGAKPMCCRKPSYGPYESKIILTQIAQLLSNKWIEPCGGPWGSMIVLAQKPHQESITNIDDFVWRMCVSYRRLNAVTKPFQFPIPRCDDAITILGTGASEIWVISLDARQGYHQISVRKNDREKLAFFAPDDLKYCFNVMPFGPTNAPPFYTAMMKKFKTEWDKLFVIRALALKLFNGKAISLQGSDTILIGTKSLIWGSKTIIDDILLWCDHKTLLLLYLKCVCEVFQKYRVSFRLDKCEFLNPRIEYVGHDVLTHGNCPAR